MKNKRVSKQVFLEAFNMMNSERNSVFINDLEQKIGEAVLKTKNIEEANLTSAVSLTETEKTKFQMALKKLLHRDVKINYRTDPKLLGGFKVVMGDWKLDGTLLYQLEHMKQALGGS